MVVFWVMAALTLAAAYAFFASAMAGKLRRSDIDRQRINLLLHRQRREELANESGGEDLGRLQEELDKDLLGDLAASESARQTRQAQGRGLLVAALIAAPLFGILLYSMLGRLDLADFSAGPEARRQADVPPEIREMIERLAGRLKNEPNDLKGWMLLARSYQQTGQFDQAVDAYRNALKLEPDNLQIKAFYAEALGESQGGDFSGEAAQIAAEILAQDPKQPTALWLAGAGAAQGGDSRRAIGYLETLRGEYPENSPNYQRLSAIIGDLKGERQAEAGAETAPQDAPAPGAMPATGERKSIKVKVSVAAALKSKASPDDAVFIFARAAAGPPMPLAIVRKQVKDLPATVTLDDSMSMVEGMNLSTFDRLVIGARVSKTGQALPGPGDLQGLTEPMEIENGGNYSVEIGEELRQ